MLHRPDSYIKLPSSTSDLGQAQVMQHNVFRRSDKEVVSIETLLCSTKLTQNGNITLNCQSYL